MDLEVTRKSLSKRGAFSTKKIAFIAVAGLVLVGGVVLRAAHYFGEAPKEGEPAPVEAAAPASEPASAPEAAPTPPPATITESTAPAASPATTTQSVTAPPPPPAAATEPMTPPAMQQAVPAASEPAEQAGDTVEQSEPAGEAVDQAEQSDLPGAGMILVSRKPVEVLASPSASAPAMYGFPAGRPFRVIGRENGFVRIKDLKSSATGWIDEAALAPPPSAPAVAMPAQQPSSGASGRKATTVSTDPKPKTVKKSSPTVADTEPAEPDPAQTRRSPGLFGGLFGGIFGNGNSR